MRGGIIFILARTVCLEPRLHSKWAVVAYLAREGPIVSGQACQPHTCRAYPDSLVEDHRSGPRRVVWHRGSRPPVVGVKVVVG